MASILSAIADGFSLIKVGAYVLFRRIFPRKEPKPKPVFDVLMLGITGAGKTTILSQLLEEELTNIAPTQGFQIKPITMDNIVLNIKEIGGSDKFRQYWSRYLAGNAGLIFVIDSSSDADTLKLALDELKTTATDRNMAGLPLCILVHKQDVTSALSADEIKSRIDPAVFEGREYVVVQSTINDRAQLRQALQQYATIFDKYVTGDENQ